MLEVYPIESFSQCYSEQGSKEETVLKLSDKILHQFDGLRMLKDATLEELISIHGIGISKASQLMATFELGRRMVRLEYQNRYSIRSPEDCVKYMMEEMRFYNKSILFVYI